MSHENRIETAADTKRERRPWSDPAMQAQNVADRTRGGLDFNTSETLDYRVS